VCSRAYITAIPTYSCVTAMVARSCMYVHVCGHEPGVSHFTVMAARQCIYVFLYIIYATAISARRGMYMLAY
jgi:hypothetical protein